MDEDIKVEEGKVEEGPELLGPSPKIKKPKKQESLWLEWLITYGWAILIVVAAIGALFYFGVIQSVFVPTHNCQCEACNYTISMSNTTGTEDIRCCTNASWNDRTKECNYVYQTAKIRINNAE